MGDTAISWTDKVWNPTTGCSVVSPGCEHCYAEALSLRHGWSKKPWTAINAAENVVLHPDRLDLPLRWRKPARIFVNSMSDLFHEQIPDWFIDQVFAVMVSAPQHTFQVLTKRPARMRDYLTAPDRERDISEQVCASQMPVGCPLYKCSEDCEMDGIEWLAPNIWLGTSVEDQRRADERIPDLVATPAAVRFLSCEPLLGQIDLTPWLPYYTACGASRDPETVAALDELFRAVVKRMGGPGIDWVIDGGESGPGFRAANPDWFRSLRDQCAAAGIRYFHKQDSGLRPGKGTLLDGVEHHAFPEVAERAAGEAVA
ncbi:MAG TPA: phage Gp37/Gp68 family protein [Chloroflexota bacterium]|jgi:protein gp37